MLLYIMLYYKMFVIYLWAIKWWIRTQTGRQTRSYVFIVLFVHKMMCDFFGFCGEKRIPRF